MKNGSKYWLLLDNLKKTFDNSGACEGEPVRVLVYLLRDGAKEVYEAYNGNGMSTDVYFCHETWPWVIDALIKHS